MRINYKIWICTEEGEKIFGEGPYNLLRGVEKNCSLHLTSQSMSISYSKALKVIKNAEKELGFKLLDRAIGGKNGGGSSITKQARELLEKYEEFQKRAGLEIERIYMEIFPK